MWRFIFCDLQPWHLAWCFYLQGWGKDQWSDNVKTAFFVNNMMPETAYTVHVPWSRKVNILPCVECPGLASSLTLPMHAFCSCILQIGTNCMANRTIIWINHLMDAYTERSFFYESSANKGERINSKYLDKTIDRKNQLNHADANCSFIILWSD